jgi:hypothetical protein
MTSSKILHGAAALSLLVLVGCAGPGGRSGAPAGSAAAPAPQARCDAQAAQYVLGQSFGPAVEREVRARSGASLVRWLSPGQAVTMDLNPARLNLTLDSRSRITKAACG